MLLSQGIVRLLLRGKLARFPDRPGILNQPAKAGFRIGYIEDGGDLRFRRLLGGWHPYCHEG